MLSSIQAENYNRFNPISMIEKHGNNSFLKSYKVIAENKAVSFGQGAPNFPVLEILKTASKLAYEDI